jgi:hypothetical protein
MGCRTGADLATRNYNAGGAGVRERKCADMKILSDYEKDGAFDWCIVCYYFGARSDLGRMV